MQSKLDDSDPAETTVSPTPAIDHVGGLEAAVVPQRRRSWPRPTPVAVVLVGLVALGAWLRLHAFGFPSTLQFDEPISSKTPGTIFSITPTPTITLRLGS